MATFEIRHGATIETITPTEAQALIAAVEARDRPLRVRAAEVLLLDAAGSGTVDVYTCPVGFEFEARRITLDLDQISDPFNSIALAGQAARFIEYLRSGTRIEYGVPQNPSGSGRVPGVQVWGAEQGPYIRNGEVFQIRCTGLLAAARLSVSLEGIQRRPYAKK